MSSSLPAQLRLLTLLLAGALASCQSGRPAFRFQSASPLLVEETSAPPVGHAPLPAAAPELAAGAGPKSGSKPKPARPRELRTRLKRQVKVWASAAHRPAATPTNGRLTHIRPAPALMRRHREATGPAAAAAENGLGTMFLGILGILALLIGLLGLLIAGGGFFGVLAAAGAVALLISIFAPILMGWGG